MPNKLSNWCQESCTTIGTGDLILNGVISTSQTRFRDGLIAGDVYYSVSDGSSREAGIGTYNGSNKLIRAQVHATLVNGVYNTTNPAPIALSGDAIVEGTFNNHAYQEIVDTIATHDTSIQVNTDNISTLQLTAPTQDQKDGLNASVNPGTSNRYITAEEWSTVDTGLNDHIAATVDAHDASAISFDNTGSGLLAINTQEALIELDTGLSTIDADVAFRETAITALESGGAISGNGSTAITINTGRGEVVDSYTDTENQTTVEVTWNQQTYDLLANAGMPIATGLGYTEVGIDSSGLPVNAPNGFSSSQRRSVIILGKVEYRDQVITNVKFSPIVSNQVGNTLMDMIDYIELGSRIKGLVLRPTSLTTPDLSMWRDIGSLFSVGSNYENAINDQNVKQIPAVGAVDTPMADFTPVLYNNGTAQLLAATGVVPTDQFETDGAGVLDNITNGNAVIHYMFESIGSGNHYMAYAQAEYPSYAEAKNNLFADRASFNFPIETSKMILLAQIVVLKNETVWGANAEIFPLDSATSSGSGAGSATTAINIDYTDTYALGSNVQTALDSLAALKLTTDQHDSLGVTSAGANPPTATNAFVTVDDLAQGTFPSDADTLDGLDSLQFLRSDQDSTTTGQLKGITPVAADDLTRKDYVDTQAALPNALGANMGKNLLINGDFSVWQRGTSFGPQSSLIGYTADRWNINNSGATIGVTKTQTEYEGNGLTGIKLDTTTGDDYAALWQIVEDARNVLQEDLTLSMIFDSNISTLSSRFYFRNITQSLSHTLGTVTLPNTGGVAQLFSTTFAGTGLPAGWLATDEIQLYCILAEQAAAGTTPWVFTAYRVQLELGDTATDFEVLLSSIRALNCRHYFRISEATGQAAEFQHEMRALPTETGAGPYAYDAELY